MLNGHHDRQRIILYLEVDDLVKQNHRRHLEIKHEKLREEITIVEKVRLSKKLIEIYSYK